MDKSRSFFDYLVLIIKWRKFLLINFVLVCISAAVISYIIPEKYSAVARIMPKEEDIGGLSSFLSTGLLTNLGMPGLSIPSAIYVGILKSHGVQEKIIDKFNLVKRYNVDYKDWAFDILIENIDIMITEDGVIRLEVTDKSADTAAAIANQFIEELDNKYITMNTLQARNNRLFLEKRLGIVRHDLAVAEDALKDFQQKNKTIALPEQTVASINAAAALKAKATILEIEKDILIESMDEANPLIIQMRQKLKAINGKIRQFEKGDSQSAPSVLNVPLNKVPELGLAYARLFREVKVQEMIYEYMMPQYEQAKYQEAKDSPALKILDYASVPEVRIWPKRKLIVVLSGFFCLICSFICILLFDYFERLKVFNSAEYAKFLGVVGTLRNDLKLRRKDDSSSPQ